MIVVLCFLGSFVNVERFTEIFLPTNVSGCKVGTSPICTLLKSFGPTMEYHFFFFNAVFLTFAILCFVFYCLINLCLYSIRSFAFERSYCQFFGKIPFLL